MLVAEMLDPTKLVFVDECGTHTSLAPVYGYTAKGERLKLSVPNAQGRRHGPGIYRNLRKNWRMSLTTRSGASWAAQ